MRNKTTRSKTIEDRRLDGNKRLEITVRYEEGGWNYYSGGKEARGYYLGVTPCEVQDGMRSCMLGAGIKTLLQPATRYSEKVLAGLSPDPAKIEDLCTSVLLKSKKFPSDIR